MTSTHTTTIAAESPVWLITGCSTGFGRELARLAIEQGFRTVVTARHTSSLQDFAAADNALLLGLDVTQPDQVAAAMRAAEARFGSVDVLVNNAGIGYFAAVEESDEAEVRKMFEVNVFGTSRMIHAVLPGMRTRRRGVIVNVSSIAGLRPFPAVGYYNATKFAVEGLSGALRQEVEPLGIKVIVVEPSDFRTDWAGRSANETREPLADYVATAGVVRAHLRAISGHQAGDPVRAAQAIIAAVGAETPPRHLLLGNDAYDGAMSQLEALREQFSIGEAVARAADFPKPAPQVKPKLGLVA